MATNILLLLFFLSVVCLLSMDCTNTPGLICNGISNNTGIQGFQSGPCDSDLSHRNPKLSAATKLHLKEICVALGQESRKDKHHPGTGVTSGTKCLSRLKQYLIKWNKGLICSCNSYVQGTNGLEIDLSHKGLELLIKEKSHLKKICLRLSSREDTHHLDDGRKCLTKCCSTLNEYLSNWTKKNIEDRDYDRFGVDYESDEYSASFVVNFPNCLLFSLDPKTENNGSEVLAYLNSRWSTIFIPSIYTVVFLLSLPCNVIAIIIFMFRIRVKTPSVVFMLNLAVSDVLFVILLPFNIVYRISGNNWVFGEGMCCFVTAAFYCNMYCSILLMTGISVDRFLAVVYPIPSLLWRTVKRAWITCFFIWLVSIAGNVPLLLRKLTFHVDHLNVTTCYDLLNMTHIESFYFYYFTAYISIFFLLPFIITTFCYVVTIRSLSSSTVESNFKKSRSVFLCVIVLFEYIICFGPTNIIFLTYYLNFDKPFGNFVYFVYMLSVSCSTISCCLDPVIYYFGSSKYKKLVYRLVCCGKYKADHRQNGSYTKSTTKETLS
ncbi:proteinase-activated receptor 1-like [Rana temporaria]|uniref:proteinase-activated receptor 1-like n=1 Tax=Rana temporaria TaxID=8407 RepID=UPI001AADBEAE|nr:proteinase-activated receptor 1-like [Rana temporaria]